MLMNKQIIQTILQLNSPIQNQNMSPSDFKNGNRKVLHNLLGSVINVKNVMGHRQYFGLTKYGLSHSKSEEITSC